MAGSQDVWEAFERVPPVWADARGPFELDLSSPSPAELAALLAGQKPVIYVSGRARDPVLARLCRRFGLRRVVVERRGVGGRRNAEMLLGRDPAALREAARAAEDMMAARWGVALGYPSCCVRAYLAARGRCPVEAALRRTRSRAPLPFTLNNLLNMFSRLRTEEDRRRAEELDRLNPGLPHARFCVVPWHPCSYDCAPSRRAGAAAFAALGGGAPRFASLLEAMLRRAYFRLGPFAFVALKGARRKSGGWSYERPSLPPATLLPLEALGALAGGRRIVQRGARVSVRASGTLWSGPAAGPAVADFTGGARG